MANSSDINLRGRIDVMTQKGLRRNIHELPFTGGVNAPEATGGVGVPEAEGATKYNLSCNDYLNLIHHPYLQECASSAMAMYGVGSGGSRLMGGATPLHGELEERLAVLTGFPSTLLVGSGYLANYGLLTALLGKSDYVFFDKLNHASLLDGILHSGCKWKSFPHKNYHALEEGLRRIADPSVGGIATRYANIYIVTDSIFSMDGDRADLVELQRLSTMYGAKLIIDESHAMGIMGIMGIMGGAGGGGGGGGGLCVEMGVRPYIVVGTLSKAYASYGGFISCSHLVREYLLNTMRTFIFSTSLPPAVVASSLGALDIVAAAPTMGSELLLRARMFHGMLMDAGLRVDDGSGTAADGSARSVPMLLPFSSQIVPVMVYDNDRAVVLSRLLGEAGVHVRAIRYPTVPLHGARLRFSITLGFDEGHLAEIAHSVVQVIAKSSGTTR